MANHNIKSQIIDHFLSRRLPVSEEWVTQFLSSRVSSTPFSSLTRTALFRLLSSDFTKSLSSRIVAHVLPADVAEPTVKERRVAGPVPLQVLDIEDIGTSLWSQVEALERLERGEQMRGREIIRTVTRDPGGGDLDAVTNTGNPASNSASATEGGAGSTASSNGPHKLMLEDAKGTKVAAIELMPVDEISIEKIPIGTKLLIKNATVARGLMLLEPSSITILGGKIDTMDKEWKEKRKATLLAKLEETQAQET